MSGYTHHVTPGDDLGNWVVSLRSRGGSVVEMRQGASWTPAPLRILARHYPADSPTWEWLRSHGVTRPSPSGPGGRRVAPNAPKVSYRPSADARRALDALAEGWGATLSETIDRAVLEAAGATK